ncbi:MAG TPA: protein phosphatase 2C domain-containing protein [Kofleriaceae bacterium]|nr:protein phosphatase 2C domain-containing protein [Kofleriaceae bacterium]
MRTDVGVVRERNEDSAHVDERGRFVIVCDGMGGHGAGDVASQMAVALVRDAMEEDVALFTAYALDPTADGRTALAAQMRRVVEHVNRMVYERSEREPELHQMGSTLELVVVCGEEAFIAHVGDSRTYLVRNGRVAQLTVDHTVAETMRRAGTINAEEARVSPMRSVLSNAIGVTPTVTVELLRIDLKPGDRLLVCSDGLHDYFSREELGAHLISGDLDVALARMIDHAKKGGGHDNITGVIIEARTRPSATEPPLPAVDGFEEEPTNPVPVPHDTAVPSPIGGISDESLAHIIDHTLRESSRPYSMAEIAAKAGDTN